MLSAFKVYQVTELEKLQNKIFLPWKLLLRATIHIKYSMSFRSLYSRNNWKEINIIYWEQKKKKRLNSTIEVGWYYTWFDKTFTHRISNPYLHFIRWVGYSEILFAITLFRWRQLSPAQLSIDSSKFEILLLILLPFHISASKSAASLCSWGTPTRTFTCALDQ